MAENKQLINGKWVEAKPLEFYYPQWIETIPIRFVRKIVKNWYWKHGELLEWQIEKWRDNHGRE